MDKLIEINKFEGLLLQQLKIVPAHPQRIPTLGVCLNKMNKFELHVNYDFFDQLTLDEQVAVLKHEMLHLRHKHVLIRNNFNPENHKLINMGMDLAINQLIKNLPEGALCVDDFIKVDGTPFDRDQPFEVYTRWLKELKNSSKDTKDEEGTEPQDPLDKNGKPKKSGNGEIRDKNGKLWTNSMDSHDWELSEDALKELRDLFRRTLDKQIMTYGSADQGIREEIEILTKELKNLNYKALVDMAYRKSMPSHNRISTWKKPSRRYGFDAKGHKSDESPRIDTYCDTSGSISINEYNDFLTTNDKFLAYANKECTLNFFHDTIYKTIKYKIGKKLTQTDIESGGTNLEDVIQKINQTKPDLAIIFTDGYYGNVSIEKLTTKVLFIISENGTIDHPLKHLGTTVRMPSSK